MTNYCANCGTKVEKNAVFCQVCGANLVQQQSYNHYQANQPQGSVPPQQPPYQQQPYQQNYQTPPQPNHNSFFLLQEISNKLRTVAIIWLITGILQIMLGASFWATERSIYVGGIFIIIAGIGNIAFACIHFGYSKNIMTNPASVLRTFDTPALYITNLVYNVIIGALLGIVGGIYALTIRSFVQSNMYILQQNGYYNPNHNGMPPQPPPYQNGTYYTPPSNPYTQAPPPQSPDQNQQNQNSNSNPNEEQTKNSNDDQSNH